MATITGMEVLDVRFPTSRVLDGSDAMNPDPDYSAAYVVLHTDGGPDGYALAFTIGRGNDVQAAAIKALEHHVVGKPVPEDASTLAALSAELIGDSQFRWLGPEKGVAQMAIGAVVNAAWDLAARRADRPLWKFLAEMTPEELVSLVDFRYLSDAITEQEALDILRAAEPGRAERTKKLEENGYQAYSTAPGWLGYSDEKLVRLAKQAVSDGFSMIKLKVGGNLDDDIRRLKLARETVGPKIRIAVDANQRWDVTPAIEWMTALAPFDPYWIEEPTSPDDVLGHAAIAKALDPIKVATGEHVQNRVVFKQMLQAGSMSVLQLDAARVGGVNENVAILLLAAKFGVPVCPHAGGVGLCEMVRHLSMFDFVAVSGTDVDRSIEWVDNLHEHFADPAVVRDGRYLAPSVPGFSTRMHDATLRRFLFPNGPEWTENES
ncbi:MAG: L-fuconate dehydratase [Amycolatopsis sp.]|uniref:enolase C-terminal domain-like protein n=1 Tax=Amycolatopsis sp. TaxID=37632 RepID=UPI00260F86FD|nr:enolase C-terminal domain-like protein [Amycolatopsis sp.]MCU1685056.1 L-fuconate dehydratase [Amycolatopsis sp.]